jgi:hypothetical protein
MDDQVRLVLDKLHFANGVAVSPDQSYLLVAEGGRYRLQRLWLSAPRAGETEIFIENLPGFPDNLHSNGEDIFWLALISPRKAIAEWLAMRPFARKIVYRLPEFLKPAPRSVWLCFGIGWPRSGRTQSPGSNWYFFTDKWGHGIPGPALPGQLRWRGNRPPACSEKKDLKIKSPA